VGQGSEDVLPHSLTGPHAGKPSRHQSRMSLFARSARRLSSAATRPFRVLGLQQVAIGALDKGRLSALWDGVLGVPKVGSYKAEKENVDEDIHALGPGPWAVEVDLMQPIDPNKAPKVHIPALNHIGLWVDDLPAAVTWLDSQGVRFAPGGIRKGAAGHDVTFIHPKGNEDKPLCGEGILLELVQAPADVIAAHNAHGTNRGGC
jgi:lactoylglutathione lyase